MRIEAVHAVAFGPLRGERLEFAPGFTLVWGPNESGKSSWHAALYAGLCGMRRGKGAPRNEDRAFAERHRPWDGQEWRVGATVVLADGRRIELSHDLAGLVDCRATDIGLGRDVSDELMNEGTPDGAKLLGLTRRTLLPTICVRQAELLSVLEGSEGLQEALQRAAATGGADDTAERALERLATFRRERVGLERRTSTKPLMQAVRRVEEAQEAAATARAAHEAYLELARRRDEAQQRADAAAEQLLRARATVAHEAFRRARSRHERALELRSRLPGEGPPPEPADDDSWGDRIAQALVAWERRPEEPPALHGPSAEELEAELAALPQPPDGDTEIARVVASARDAWRSAAQAVAFAEEDPGPETAAPPPLPSEATAGRLRDLADALEASIPPMDPELGQQMTARRARAGGRRAAGLLAAAGLGVAGGLGLVAIDRVAGGVVLLLAAVALGVVAGILGRGRGRQPSAHAEARLAVQRAAAEQASERQAAARAQAAAWGLQAEAAELRRLAGQIDEHSRTAEERQRRDARLARRREEVEVTAERLREALGGRGIVVDTAHSAEALSAAVERYEEACRANARQAAEAARADDLRARLASRRELDRAAAEQRQTRADAELEVREAAAAVGIPAAGDEDAALADLVESLRAWQRRRAEDRRERGEARDTWMQLQSLLDGDDVEDLATAVEERRAALAAYEGVDPLPFDEDGDSASLERLQEAASTADRALAGLTAQLEDRATTVASVPESEEALIQARADLERLRRLDSTLQTTQEYLEAARERVHRDVAPRLKASVERWLPSITAGRYEEALVDPGTLAVQVRGKEGSWRQAHLLSHGTAEQIYLLLRVALAEHLVTSGEPAPLLLDDPTVQSDANRTAAILDLLRAVSEERQVIVFSQEDEVLAWAKRSLTGADDAVVEIGPDPIPV